MFNFLLDYVFLGLHTFLILFNLFGWISKRTRWLNFLSLLLTGASWVGLGIFYGWGYCPLTDWHFALLREMGETGLPDSYIAYFLNRLLDMELTSGEANRWTLITYLLALFISIITNVGLETSKSNGTEEEEE